MAMDIFTFTFFPTAFRSKLLKILVVIVASDRKASRPGHTRPNGVKPSRSAEQVAEYHS